MTSILLINDTSDQNNWGCQGTSRGLRTLLSRDVQGPNIDAIRLNWIRKRYRRWTVGPFRGKHYEAYSGDPNRRRSLGARVVNRIRYHASAEADPYPISGGGFDAKAMQWLDGVAGPAAEDFIRRANEADIVVLNGEGSVFGNARKGVNALFLAYLAKRYLRRPTIAINQTVHLGDTGSAMLGIVQRVFPLMDALAVREPRSKAHLEEIGTGKRTELVPDALFSLFDCLRSSISGDWQEQPAPDADYVCIGGSSILAHTAPWRPISFYEDLVNALKRRVGSVVLVAKDRDDWFLENVARRCGGVYFGPDHSLEDFFSLVARAQLFITGRYHHIIFASMAGCPFLPFNANTHKIEGVCELLNWHRTTPYDLTDPVREFESLVAECDRLLDSHDARSRALVERSQVLSRQTGRISELVAETLAANQASRVLNKGLV